MSTRTLARARYPFKLYLPEPVAGCGVVTTRGGRRVRLRFRRRHQGWAYTANHPRCLVLYVVIQEGRRRWGVYVAVGGIPAPRPLRTYRSRRRAVAYAREHANLI